MRGERSAVRPSSSPDAGALSMVIRLRWIALAAQLIALVAVSLYWDAPLSWLRFSLLLSALALSNLALPRLRLYGREADLIGASALLDVGLLTGALASFGGPENPFSVLYLVQLTLVATLSTQRWTWLIVLSSSLGFALLFWLSEPLPPALGGAGHQHHHGSGGFAAHLQGMWLAYSISAVAIGLFVSGLSSSLRESRLQQEKTARLLGLAALAAGAAHEIGNPLGTIKIAAAELERGLEAREALSEFVDDAALICDEVERASDVLKRLASAAGELAGEGLQRLSVPAMLEQLIADRGLSDGRVTLSLGPELPEPHWPKQAITQILTQLLRNALQASESYQNVTLGARLEGERLCLWVRDEGCGMSPDQVERAGEPFYTTREDGMGLGVFVARSLVEQLRGSFHLESKLAAGTVVTIRLPLNIGEISSPQAQAERTGERRGATDGAKV